MPCFAGAISSQCRYSVAKSARGVGLLAIGQGLNAVPVVLGGGHRRGRPNLRDLASGCCENGHEFGQIDDREWFSRAIRAVDEGRRKNRWQRLYISPVHRVALFSSRSGIGRRSTEWGLKLLPIVDLPEFDPVFPTSRVEIRLLRRFLSGAAIRPGVSRYID